MMILYVLFLNEYIIEIFLPCYYGSSVLEKSKSLTTDIYKSNWIQQNPKFKKSLMILVERTFRPIATFVAGLFGLNLTTFISVDIRIEFFCGRPKVLH